jgi:hypothetical protein
MLRRLSLRPLLLGSLLIEDGFVFRLDCGLRGVVQLGRLDGSASATGREEDGHRSGDQGHKQKIPKMHGETSWLMDQLKPLAPDGATGARW